MTEYVIEYHSEALTDSGNAYIWYELQQKGLGERFLDQIRDTIRIITTSPEVYSTKSRKDYREARLKDFPYLVVYKVLVKKEERIRFGHPS